MEVGDGNLGGGHEIQIVARDDVHEVFFVGDLTGSAGRSRVHQRRRPDLGHAVLGRVDVEHHVDERPLESRALARVDRKSGAGDLGSTLEIEHLEVRGDIPVGPAGPRCAIRGGVLRQQVAPGSDDLVGRFVADRDVRVGGVRDAQQQRIQGGLRCGQLGVEFLDLGSGIGRSLLERRDLGAGGGRAGSDRFADLFGGRVALSLEPVRIAEQLAAAAVEHEGLIHDGRVFALVDRSLTDPIRILAQPDQPDAHAFSPGGLRRPEPHLLSARECSPAAPTRRRPRRREGARRRKRARGWPAASRREGRSIGRGRPRTRRRRHARAEAPRRRRH